MKKDEIIERLQEYCDERSYSTGGYSERTFYIHMKKSDSFQVRKGNYLEWDDNDVLTIRFTKEIKATIKNKVEEREGFWGKLGGALETMGDIYAHNKKKEEDRVSAKQKKIKWHWISDIG